MTIDELRQRLIDAGERVTIIDSISEAALARLLGISHRTMRDRRTRQGDVPRFRVNGRSVVFDLVDVLEYLDERRSPATRVNKWQFGRM